jgi:dihydropteroate synthase
MATLKLLDTLEDVNGEFEKIGVYREGAKIMAHKFLFRVIKLSSVDTRAANILKQEMLSLGAEAAVSKGTVDFSAKTTDVLLSGTLKHYTLLIEKLKVQPFGLKQVSEEISAVLDMSGTQSISEHFQKASLFDTLSPSLNEMKCGKYSLDFKKQLIMGILNLTPDSFSDGGKFIPIDSAVEHAKKMVKDGADIIDIGGESSRPNAEPVSEEEELKRVLPVLERLAKEVSVPISIDTYKPRVADECIKRGACIINDISGLRDAEMIAVAKKHDVPVIIMHMRGTPNTMQKDTQYDDVISDIFSFFTEKITEAKKAGVSKIILDPGIGFGKNAEHNLLILKSIPEFLRIGYPLLIGASRKSFIGTITDSNVDERLPGSLASACIAALNGAHIIRVHDVLETKKALQIVRAVRNA